MKHGNGNYLGQTFDGVQPCPRCHGKGFLNHDGSPNNAFDGLDADSVVGCPECQEEPQKNDPGHRPSRHDEYNTLPEFWRIYIMGLENAVRAAEASEAQLARIAGEYERRYMAILGPDLLKRREEQDASHGGPEHDDTHTPEDWCRFIQDYAYRARIAALEVNEALDSGITMQLKPNQAEYEDRMKDVACLAISAILSSRRKGKST